MRSRSDVSAGSQRAIELHRGYGRDSEAAIRHCITLARNLLYSEGKCHASAELYRRAGDLLDGSRWKLRAYILSQLSRVLLLDDRTEEAWNVIQEGLNLVRGKSSAWEDAFFLNAISYLLRTKKPEDAKKYIDRLKSKQTSGKTSLTYLMALNYEGHYYFDSALLNPDKTLKYLTKARDCFEESENLESRIHSSSIRSLNNNALYLVLRHLGEYELAAEKLERQIRERNFDIIRLSNAHVTLAEIYKYAGKLETALSLASKALQMAETHGMGRLALDAHAVLAYLYYDMDEYEKSIEECNRQIAAYACIDGPENFKHHSARLWSHMGHCYKELGRWDKAAIFFESAVGTGIINNVVMSAHVGLGEVCYHQHKFDLESKHFEKAEQILAGIPENTWADSYRYRITQLKMETHLKMNEIEKARELLPALEQLMDDDRNRIDGYNDLKKRLSGTSKNSNF